MARPGHGVPTRTMPPTSRALWWVTAFRTTGAVFQPTAATSYMERAVVLRVPLYGDYAHLYPWVRKRAF